MSKSGKNYQKYVYVHAGPSSGKSVMAKETLKQGHPVIDTDDVLFNLLITSSMKKELEASGWKPNQGSEQEKLLYKAVTRGALLIAERIASERGGYLFTNLTCYDALPVEKFYESVSVFRKPEDLHRTINDRRKEQHDDAPEISLKVITSWYEGWKKGVSKFGRKITLETGQFLADVFGIKASHDVHAAGVVTDGVFPELRKEGWFDIIEPDPKTETSKSSIAWFPHPKREGLTEEEASNKVKEARKSGKCVVSLVDGHESKDLSDTLKQEISSLAGSHHFLGVHASDPWKGHSRVLFTEGQSVVLKEDEGTYVSYAKGETLNP